VADVQRDGMIEIMGRTVDARKALRALGGDIGNVNTLLMTAGRTSGIVGRRMMAFSGAALAGLAQAGRMAASFGQGMAEVSTLVDTSVVNMDRLAEGVKDLSVASGRGLDDLTKGLYDTISAGVDAGESIEFLGTASRLAVAGVTDVATSVDLLTTVVNAYGASADEAAIISDQLFATVQIGKTTVPELANAMQYVAGTASQAGISTQELLAAIAALTLQGMPATVAARSLNQALLGFIKPSSEAAKKAAELGIGLNATTLQSEGLIGALEQIREGADGDIEAMAELAGSTEALRALLALAGEGFGDFSGGLDSIGESAGGVGVAVGKMQETVEERMNRLKQQMEVIMVDIGTAVVPAAEAMGEELMPQLERFADWIEQNPQAVVAWGEVMVAVFATGALLQATSGVVTLIVQLSILAGGMEALGVAALALAAPAGALAALALAVAAIAKEALDAQREVEELATTMDQKLRGQASAALEYTAKQLREMADEIPDAALRAEILKTADNFEELAKKGEDVADVDMTQAVLSLRDLLRTAEDTGAAEDALRSLTLSLNNVSAAARNARNDVAAMRAGFAEGLGVGPARSRGRSIGSADSYSGGVPRGSGKLVYAGSVTGPAGSLQAGGSALDVMMGEFVPRFIAAQEDRLTALQSELTNLQALDKLSEDQRARMGELRDHIRLTQEGMRRVAGWISDWADFIPEQSTSVLALTMALRFAADNATKVGDFWSVMDENLRAQLVDSGEMTEAEFRAALPIPFMEELERLGAAGQIGRAMERLVAELFPRISALRAIEGLPTQAGPGAFDTDRELALLRGPRNFGIPTQAGPGAFDTDRELALLRGPRNFGIPARLGPPEFGGAFGGAFPGFSRLGGAMQDYEGPPLSALFVEQTDEALSTWERFTSDLEADWDMTTGYIENSFINSLTNMIVSGKLDFGNFFETIGRMAQEAGTRAVVEGLVTEKGASLGSWGAMLGGLVGGPVGALAGSLVGLFDSPLNDLEARQSARDFSREFAAGAREGIDRRGGGGGGVIVNQYGTNVYSYPTDADTEAARQARALERLER